MNTHRPSGLTDKEWAAERLLDARIALDQVVRYPDDGFQERYCACVDRIARDYDVSAAELAEHWLRHHGVPDGLLDVNPSWH